VSGVNCIAIFFIYYFINVLFYGKGVVYLLVFILIFVSTLILMVYAEQLASCLIKLTVILIKEKVHFLELIYDSVYGE